MVVVVDIVLGLARLDRRVVIVGLVMVFVVVMIFCVEVLAAFGVTHSSVLVLRKRRSERSETTGEGVVVGVRFQTRKIYAALTASANLRIKYLEQRRRWLRRWREAWTNDTRRMSGQGRAPQWQLLKSRRVCGAASRDMKVLAAAADIQIASDLPGPLLVDMEEPSKLR